ncbi:hypothetical protein JW935_02350 [candidate division KSB1 bacterium]|nr:hypothetical protein [candidate division KSB1 bacterium]
MSTLWEDIRETIRDGIELVVDKTEEYSKIGKLNVEIMSIKRNVGKSFTELGGHVYELLSKKKEVKDDDEVKRLIREIKELESKLENKKADIEHVKEDKEKERKERDEKRKNENEEQEQE